VHGQFKTIQIGFTFLVPARPGYSPGKTAVKRACMFKNIFLALLRGHRPIAPIDPPLSKRTQE